MTMPVGLPAREYLSASAAARRIGISRPAFVRAVTRGDLAPALHTRGGYPRFTLADVDAYARRRHAGSPVASAHWHAHAARVGEDRFRALFEGSPIPSYIWQQVGADLVLVAYNAAAAATAHIDAGMLDRTVRDVLSDDPAIAATLMRALREQTTVRRRLPPPATRAGAGTVLDLLCMFVPPNLVMAQAQDVTDLARAKLAHARLAAIVECSDDAIIGQTLDGIVESWNSGAERLYGYPAAEVIGRSIAMLAPPDRTDEIPRLLARLRAGERIDHVETVHVGKEGRAREVSISSAPARDDGGQIVGAVIIARDVTALKDARRQAERARAATEHLARMRDDFVATTSHELRTPLTGILGFAELLRSRWGRLDEATQLRQLDRIIASAQRQKRLIDDLLLLSRMDDVPLVPRREVVALEAVIRRAAAEVVASYRGQHVDCDGPREAEALADPDKIFQVVANLVDNAAKHSPEGSPITIRWGREGATLTVRVSDRGPGVPESNRDRLFTRFGRLPGSQMRAGRVGTGLGLYLSKQFARAMSGDLSLEASGGGVTTFLLSLPAAGEQVSA